MQRHNYLYDSIPRTEDMPDAEFTKYVEICKNQTEPTSEALIQRIKVEHYAHSVDTDKKLLDEIWQKIEPRLVANEGLARFILDYKGAESKYFFPWLLTIPKSPSTALEMSYGSGYDLKGRWVEDVESYDPIYKFVMNDPTFVYNRERQLFVADLASSVQDITIGSQEISKIVDFGAGRLAWTRKHGFEFRPSKQVIYAFDKDPTIKPHVLFDSSLQSLNLHYENGDLVSQLKNPNCEDSNLIILGGVASYLSMDVLINYVITPIHGLLKPNGVFFFDLQLDCPYLRRSMALWGWPTLQLFDSPGAAITEMEAIRKNLWNTGLRYSAEYAVDTYNACPTAVMISFTKLS